MNGLPVVGRLNGGQLFLQRGDIAADDRQDTFGTDRKIIMHDDVAEPGEFTPRNIGILCFSSSNTRLDDSVRI
jgi:hypothetical protein